VHISIRFLSEKHLKGMVYRQIRPFRFERGADPNNTVYALKRAALLIKELAGGTLSSEISDVYKKPD
jgi:phenylalanyl-tRNA synthetase beta subunit